MTALRRQPWARGLQTGRSLQELGALVAHTRGCKSGTPRPAWGPHGSHALQTLLHRLPRRLHSAVWGWGCSWEKHRGWGAGVWPPTAEPGSLALAPDCGFLPGRPREAPVKAQVTGAPPPDVSLSQPSRRGHLGVTPGAESSVSQINKFVINYFSFTTPTASSSRSLPKEEKNGHQWQMAVPAK